MIFLVFFQRTHTIEKRFPKKFGRCHDAPGVGTDFYLQLMAAAPDRNQVSGEMAQKFKIFKNVKKFYFHHIAGNLFEKEYLLVEMG